MKILRSNRRTLAVEITKNAETLVRAPYFVSDAEIESFLKSRRAWIEKYTKAMEERLRKYPEPDEREVKRLLALAKETLPKLTQKYAEMMGVSYKSVKITHAKTRFGSCSKSGSICYSLYLMRYPMPAIEYVVVHELCHLRHFNHSAAFYREIEKYLPDYKIRKALLSGKD